VHPSPPRKGMKVYTPNRVPSIPESNGLVRYKASQRWYCTHQAKRRDRCVPYIDRNGLIHAHVVSTWKCTSYQLYATIASTVYKRLKSVVRSIRPKDRTRPNLLMKIAALYAIDNNDSWYNRCLAMIFQSKRKQLLAHVYRMIHTVDENKRFLLDQVFHNTLWFQSRSRRPRSLGRRDKSTNDDSETFIPPYTQRLIAPCRERVSSLTQFMNIQWAAVYTVVH